MFVTPLNFNQVLERFYHQNRYDLMLLFVSSFDGNDRTIIHEIVDNAKRIDRITGNRICFFYFIKDSCDNMNEKLTRWVRDVSDWTPLYGEGVSVTMETADDICRHFAILRSNLPAFILVDKDRRAEPQLFSIHDYQDFESILTPLNIIHSYVEDKESIINRYEQERRKDVVTQDEVDKRNEQRKSWSIALQLLERKKTKELSLGLNEKVEKRKSEILEFERKLEDFPVIEVRGIDESVPYPHDELQHIKDIAIEKLSIALNSHEGEQIIEDLQSHYRYSDSVLKIGELIRTRGVRLSRILEKIRYEIHERGFDVFISCKSQDYGLAHELYDFLLSNGFKPFLADSSIKEVGIDQYTALIGEVINVCQNMVVFATDVRYLETPYVAAEWHTFINDINTGHKPNARIVSILSPDINPHDLPSWLRDKQCLTTENYKSDLVLFLRGGDMLIEQLIRKIHEANYLYKRKLRFLPYDIVGDQEVIMRVHDFLHQIDFETERIVSELESCKTKMQCDTSCFPNLQEQTNSLLKDWEYKFYHLENEVEQCREEAFWKEIVQTQSPEKLKTYLDRYPCGRHTDEAKCMLPKINSGEDTCCPEQIEHFKSERKSTKKLRCPNGHIYDSSIFGEKCPFCPSNERPYTSNEGEPSEGKSYIRHLNRTEACTLHNDMAVDYKERVMPTPKSSIWSRWLSKRKIDVYSSIFAPAEVLRVSHMFVQVYLHLFEETEKVKALAQESDKNAERRDYVPLQCKLKKGDKVDVLLNIYGETLLMSDRKSVIWQGSFTKCSFDYFVPKNIEVDELSCVALLSVNGVPVGEMRFITKIVDTPRRLNPEIIAHKYNKVFISYSHQDESKVKFLHEGLELGSVPHFFDRKYLKAGDVFPQVIQDYINSADLFILCWSENASKSEYVRKERLQALERAFPQVQPEKAAKLRIYPMSIEPRAELPSDMKENYHFGEI